jgi:ribosome-binding factor A
MPNKDNTLKEVIRELAAEFYSRESNRQTLITVTDVHILSHGGRALVLITVLPENQEKLALEFARRQLSDLREYMHAHSRIARIPFFEVDIDRGEKNRQRIEELERKLGS